MTHPGLGNLSRGVKDHNWYKGESLENKEQKSAEKINVTLRVMEFCGHVYWLRLKHREEERLAKNKIPYRQKKMKLGQL